MTPINLFRRRWGALLHCERELPRRSSRSPAYLHPRRRAGSRQDGGRGRASGPRARPLSRVPAGERTCPGFSTSTSAAGRRSHSGPKVSALRWSRTSPMRSPATSAPAARPVEGTDNIRAEIHSKGSAQALGCPRAGLRARETGGGGRPARFCQEETHVMTEQFSSMEHGAFHVPHLSDTIPEAVFHGQKPSEDRRLSAGFDPAAGRAQPAPRHPRVRASARLPHRRLHRGDRLRTGVRETPATRRADERPAARRPPGRERTLPARPVGWVRS